MFFGFRISRKCGALKNLVSRCLNPDSFLFTLEAVIWAQCLCVRRKGGNIWRSASCQHERIVPLEEKWAQTKMQKRELVSDQFFGLSQRRCPGRAFGVVFLGEWARIFDCWVHFPIRWGRKIAIVEKICFCRSSNSSTQLRLQIDNWTKESEKVMVPSLVHGKSHTLKFGSSSGMYPQAGRIACIKNSVQTTHVFREYILSRIFKKILK